MTPPFRAAAPAGWWRSTTDELRPIRPPTRRRESFYLGTTASSADSYWSSRLHFRILAVCRQQHRRHVALLDPHHHVVDDQLLVFVRQFRVVGEGEALDFEEGFVGSSGDAGQRR